MCVTNFYVCLSHMCVILNDLTTIYKFECHTCVTLTATHVCRDFTHDWHTWLSKCHTYVFKVTHVCYRFCICLPSFCICLSSPFDLTTICKFGCHICVTLHVTHVCQFFTYGCHVWSYNCHTYVSRLYIWLSRMIVQNGCMIVTYVTHVCHCFHVWLSI